MFLEILQNSQESWQIFKNTYFTEYLWGTASGQGPNYDSGDIISNWHTKPRGANRNFL